MKFRPLLSNTNQFFFFLGLFLTFQFLFAATSSDARIIKKIQIEGDPIGGWGIDTIDGSGGGVWIPPNGGDDDDILPPFGPSGRTVGIPFDSGIRVAFFIGPYPSSYGCILQWNVFNVSIPMNGGGN